MSSLCMHTPLPIPHKPSHRSYTTFYGGAPMKMQRITPATRMSSSTRCNGMPSAQTTTVTTRRSANYKPSFWDFNYIQSLTAQYTEERHSKRAVELVERVKMLLLNQEMEELHLFNDVIRRWDLEEVNQLPNYMQICFLTLNNFINEMACDVLKEQDILIIKYLRKSWQDLCKSFMQEAQWHAERYTPTKTVVESLYQYQDLVRCPSMILRLANDLATSPNEMERGDVPEGVRSFS
ncbi:1,8-cineole synthase, chloroplastic-like [Salvia divinorum]|uniref:1,8-cineole synthase, chloroplastic-like n=1 Tax=Salvia divinorum TaxID=28513 RepID=A0ABD1I7J1_SALDI